MATPPCIGHSLGDPILSACHRSLCDNVSEELPLNTRKGKVHTSVPQENTTTLLQTSWNQLEPARLKPHFSAVQSIGPLLHWAENKAVSW